MSWLFGRSRRTLRRILAFEAEVGALGYEPDDRELREIGRRHDLHVVRGGGE